MPGRPDAIIPAPGVVLRPFVPGDREALFAAVHESVAEIAPYETWCTPEFSHRDAEHYVTGWIDAWEAGAACYFAVLGDDGRFLGSAGLAGIDRTHLVAGLGYWVRTPETGRGVATAAAGAVARWGIAALGLNRVEVLIAMGNAASRRVAEKIGAEFEGILRRRLVLPQGPTDVAVYAIVSG